MVGMIMLAVATSGPLVSPPPTTEPVVATDVLTQAEEAFAEGVRRRDDPDRRVRYFGARPICSRNCAGPGAANPTLFRDQGNACLLADDLPGANPRLSPWVAPGPQ